MVTEEVRAVCFPHDDEAFVGRVRELVQTKRDTSTDRMQAAIEALLRETYPLAVIWPRQAMAAIDGLRVWYVYRDGSVLSRDALDA